MAVHDIIHVFTTKSHKELYTFCHFLTLCVPSGIRPRDAVGDPYFCGGCGSRRHRPHLPGQQCSRLLAGGRGHVLHDHVPPAGLRPLLQSLQWLWSHGGSADRDHHEGVKWRAAHWPPARHQVPRMPGGRRGEDDPVLSLPHCHHVHLHGVHPAHFLADVHHFQQGPAAREVGCVQNQTWPSANGGGSQGWEETENWSRWGWGCSQAASEHHQLLEELATMERRWLDEGKTSVYLPRGLQEHLQIFFSNKQKVQ